jgi:uncharacterized protein
MGSTKSVRTCAACGVQEHPEALVRWVLGPEGEAVPDLRGKATGRGAWIHARPLCLARIQAGLSRSFRAPVSTNAESAAELLQQAGDARAWHLLGAARRRDLVALGVSPAGDAWKSGRARGILLARDAQSAARESWVLEAVGRGAVAVWADKARFGAVFGRDEVAVLAILEQRLANELFGAIAFTLLTPKTVPRGKKKEHQSGQGSTTEVE